MLPFQQAQPRVGGVKPGLSHYYVFIWGCSLWLAAFCELPLSSSMALNYPDSPQQHLL